MICFDVSLIFDTQYLLNKNSNFVSARVPYLIFAEHNLKCVIYDVTVYKL